MTDVDHKQLARQLDHRRVKRRLGVLGTLLAAAVAALMYLRCGGTGLGGKAGTGDDGPRTTVPVLDAAIRCALRLAGDGLTLDGKAVTRDEAIAACRDKTAADVLVTGDARQGDWDELRAALEAAGIAFFAREPRGLDAHDAGVPRD